MSYILFNRAFDNSINPAELNEWMNQAANLNRYEKLFLVLPTGKLVRKTKRELITKYYAAQRIPISRINIFTLQSFVEYCFAVLDFKPKGKLVSEAYQLTLIEEAVESSELNFFKANDKKPSISLLKRLYSLIYGLKEDGITLTSIKNDLIKYELSSDDSEVFSYDKYRDIATIYEEYNKLLGERYHDAPSMISWITKKFSEDINHLNKIFPTGASILMSGFSEFKQPEIEFIACFRDASPSLVLNLDFSIKNGPLFGNFQSTLSDILSFPSFTDNPNLFSDPTLEDDSSPSQFIRKNLFNLELTERRDIFGEKLKIVETKDADEETTFVVKLVKSYLNDNGFKPADICVLMRQPSQFIDMFRQKVLEYKIPTNITERFDLERSPMVISIMSLLSLYAYGFKRRDLHRVIFNPYFDFTSKKPDFNCDNLISRAEALRIEGGNFRGGKQFWINRLSSKIDSLDKIIKLYSNSYFDDLDKYSLEKDRELTQAALNDFEFIVSIFDSIFESPSYLVNLSANEFFDNINMLLTELDFSSYLDKSLSSLTKSKSQLTAEAYQASWEELERYSRAIGEFTNVCNELQYILNERFGDKKFTLAELIARLETAISGARYQIAERSGRGVTFTAIEQSRGLDFKVVILCGANDGMFPLPYQAEKILGKELIGSESNHRKSEQIQFYQFLTNSAELLDRGERHTYLTYSQSNDEQELVRSRFVDALLKILPDNINYKQNLKENRDSFAFMSEMSSANEIVSDLMDKNFSNIEAIKQAEKYISQSTLTYLRKYNFQNFYTDKVKLDFDKLTEMAEKMLTAMKESEFSISKLETYNSCPYRYFISKVLKYEQPDSPDLALSPLERGSIMHNTLYFFYEQLLKENGDEVIEIDGGTLRGVKLLVENKQNYLQKLKDIADSEISKYRFMHPFFELDIEMMLGSEDSKGYFEFWLDEEIERCKTKVLLPVYFEFSFDKSSGAEITRGNDKLYLRGKIDRIEFAMVDGKLHFVVADYKTSKKNKTDSDVEKSESFQIPLYLEVLQGLLERELKQDMISLGGTYYNLKPAEISSNNKKVTSAQAILAIKHPLNDWNDEEDKRIERTRYDELIETSVINAFRVVQWISEGKFHVNPRPKVCDYCDYQAICKIKLLKKMPMTSI